MLWIGLIFGMFFGVMLALLVYSVVSTSLVIRKKAQPSIDTFFDGLYSFAFRRQSGSRRHPPEN